MTNYTVENIHISKVKKKKKTMKLKYILLRIQSDLLNR